MSIFESLENLNVSEECFNDIVEIVEEIINELKISTVDSAFDKRAEEKDKKDEENDKAWQEAHDAGDRKKAIEATIKASQDETDWGKKIDFYDKWLKGRKERNKNK